MAKGQGTGQAMEVTEERDRAARPRGGFLTAAVREDLARAVLCWLATVEKDGTPSVSPKEIFAPHGEDALLIANIASPGSVRNLRRHPRACASVLDVFRQRGFKLYGTATVVAGTDPGFAELAAPLLAKAGPDVPVRDAILLRIDRVARIWAPSYRLFPDRTEAERMQAAYAAYGVRPPERG